MKKINYPDNYRYICELNQFKQCVDIAKQMLANRQLSILFGSIKKVYFELWLDEKQYEIDYKELDYKEFKKILLDEVAIIVEQNFENPDFEEPELKKYLISNKIEDEDIQRIQNDKLEKRKYVQEELMNSESMSRYSLKENTLNDKLYDINYELNRFLFDDGSDSLYSIIKIETAEQIETERLPSILSANTKIDSVSFVCDKQDIEYMINMLERIKERM